MKGNFRVWEIERKRMCGGGNLYALSHSGALLKYNDRGFIVLAGENYKVMFSTGLFDKNGKEIFEGDILNNGCVSIPVHYDRGMFLVGNYPALRLCECCDMPKEYAYEVIGNIYENPELLAKN